MCRVPPIGRKESRMQKQFAKYLERGLLAVGLTLLAIFLGLRVYSAVASRAGLRMFAALQSQASEGRAAPERPTQHDVDFTLWSEKRVAAYQESLSAVAEIPMAILKIEKLDLEVPVYNGTDEIYLNRGVGWILETARPGEPGNVGIAGHRDGFFRCLKDIQIGDRMELTAPGKKAVYLVDAIEIVTPEDVGVLQPRAHPALTLVTCYPFYYVGSAPQRFIVHGSIVESGSSDNSNKSSSALKATK